MSHSFDLSNWVDVSRGFQLLGSLARKTLQYFTVALSRQSKLTVFIFFFFLSPLGTKELLCYHGVPTRGHADRIASAKYTTNRDLERDSSWMTTGKTEPSGDTPLQNPAQNLPTSGWQACSRAPTFTPLTNQTVRRQNLLPYLNDSRECR